MDLDICQFTHDNMDFPVAIGFICLFIEIAFAFLLFPCSINIRKVLIFVAKALHSSGETLKL